MADDPLTACIKCAAPAQRVHRPVAVHFKGSGFYTTDYGKHKAGAGADSASSSDGATGDGVKSDGAKSDGDAKASEPKSGSSKKSESAPAKSGAAD